MNKPPEVTIVTIEIWKINQALIALDQRSEQALVLALVNKSYWIGSRSLPTG